MHPGGFWLKLEASCFDEAVIEEVHISAALNCRAAYQLPGFHDRRPGTRGLVRPIMCASQACPRPYRPRLSFATLEGRSGGGVRNSR